MFAVTGTRSQGKKNPDTSPDFAGRTGSGSRVTVLASSGVRRVPPWGFLSLDAGLVSPALHYFWYRLQR